MHERIARNLAETYLERLENDGAAAADHWANRTLTRADVEEVSEAIRVIRQEQDQEE